MITFNKVRYRNFLSSGNNWTEIQLDRSSHTLIVGQNGAGKSTMLDAISFALFGKAHRNINKPQLVNSVNGKGMVAEIEFKVGAKEYKVVRGYKPVKFEIFVDGTLMNQNSHNKEYQKVLEQNILKLTHKTFHQVVVLGSSSFVPFMQLSALNRREVIEDLLDIGVFSKMNQILREKQAALREQTNHILHAIEINDTKQEAQKKYIRDISKINNDAKNQKETYIQETTQEVERLVKENFENQDLANAVSGEITPKISKANETLATLNSYESEFNTKIKSLVKDTKFYEKNDHCPTCDQDIGEELKSRKLGEAKAKASELQSGSVKVQQEREAVLETLAELNEKQQQVQDLLQNVQINLQTISTHNSNVDKARADIESLSDTHSDLSQANDDYDALMAEYHELMETRNKQNDQSAYNACYL